MAELVFEKYCFYCQSLGGHKDSCVTQESIRLPQLRTQVKFKKLVPAAIIPKYAHGSYEDAGMDLHCVAGFTINKGETVVVGTGIAVEMPPGIEGQVRSRSGIAGKGGAFVLNSPGTVDPGYRGELKVILHKVTPGVLVFEGGDRIAQIVFNKYEQVNAVEVEDKLGDTERGEGGMGSTGQ